MSEKIPLSNKEKLVEMTELGAAEILQTDYQLSAEEQDRLVSMVADPNLSMYVLGFDDTHGEKLTRLQAEKLLDQILANPEAAEILYTTLTESGVELNANERWWMERLRKVME